MFTKLMCMTFVLLLGVGEGALAQRVSDYAEIVVAQNGDRVFVDKNSIRLRRLGRVNQVTFSSLTRYKKIDSDWTVKTSASYIADCDASTLQLRSFWKYDANNEIVKGINYNSNSNSQYDTPASAPIQSVAPNSIGYAIWNYACDRP